MNLKKHDYMNFKNTTMKPYDESKQFVLQKQLIFLEFQLKKMEDGFSYLLEHFGKGHALTAFGTDREEYERLTCLKDSLERLDALQRNLGALSPELLETLTEKPLSEGGLLDAIIKSMSRPPSSTIKKTKL